MQLIYKFALLVLVASSLPAQDESSKELAARIDAASRKAADCLLRQQNEDGTFGTMKGSKMPGVSALAVRALAACGDDYRDARNAGVVKAVQYILSCQQESGAIATKEFGSENLNTSVAAAALAALNNPEHRNAVEKAKNYLLNCQMTVEKYPDIDKENPRLGAFGEGKDSNYNLMGTAFALEVFHETKLDQSSPAWKNAASFVRRCQDDIELNRTASMSNGASTGGFVYYPGFSEFGTYATKRGKAPKPYGTMTYQAVKSLAYCSVDKNDPALQSAFRWIKDNYDVTVCPGANRSQGYFFYAMSLAKAFSACGIKSIDLANGRKAQWAKDLGIYLLTLQKPDGDFINAEPRWMENNPVICTAYALEALRLCRAALE